MKQPEKKSERSASPSIPDHKALKRGIDRLRKRMKKNPFGPMDSDASKARQLGGIMKAFERPAEGKLPVSQFSGRSRRRKSRRSK